MDEGWVCEMFASVPLSPPLGYGGGHLATSLVSLPLWVWCGGTWDGFPQFLVKVRSSPEEHRQTTKQASSFFSVSLFLSLYSFLIRSIQQNLFLSCPNYYLSCYFTLSLFYLMFLSGWGLQHLASCPISVRSGG